jgi:hypothetical protein
MYYIEPTYFCPTCKVAHVGACPLLVADKKLRRLNEIDEIMSCRNRPKLSGQEALPLLQEGKQLTQELQLERAYVRYTRLIERIERNVW